MMCSKEQEFELRLSRIEEALDKLLYEDFFHGHPASSFWHKSFIVLRDIYGFRTRKR